MRATRQYRENLGEFFLPTKINLSDTVYVHGWIEEEIYGHLIFLDQNYQPVLALEKIEIRKLKKEKDIIINDLFQTLWRKTDIVEPKKKKTKDDSVIMPQPKKEYQLATTENLLGTKRLDHVFCEQNSKHRLFIYDQKLINFIESDSLEILNHLQNVLKDQQLKSFVIVTFGGMQVNDRDHVQPCISAIWGLIRVLRNEHRDKIWRYSTCLLACQMNKSLGQSCLKFQTKEILLIGMVRCITYL